MTAKIRIIAVGALKEDFWARAADEYCKRLRRYCKLEILEVKDLDPEKNGGIHHARQKEAIAALKALGISIDALKYNDSRMLNLSHADNKVGYTIALDSAGDLMSSEQIARFLSDLQTQGASPINLLIGGSTGLDDKLKAAANKCLSFGAITLPHNLARIVLLEQLYRAFRIIAGEPYHK
ncbi:MAG: 23S rRNA (pseudouridine(1915)-N(3))-methyltransferase RlmH [Coriobacteriales bacterium]|jgi:23S rRNA (pseudouridine1915-N3)-methyltransferase|nr:23S rRNA (pseudouridine(1915)-N(3))-methyltransferase RlmH [Coriobacteriales bacterium]